MTNQELKISATYIKKLASFPDAEDRISLYLDSLFATQPQKDTFNEPENSKSKAVSSLLHFTYKEIKNMATTFKKVFIANGLAAHVIKKESGKNSYCYEIRYRANGYCIITSSTNLQKAKEKFLAKTTPTEINKYYVGKINKVEDCRTLKEFALFFFEKHRKEKVAAQTYKCDLNRINKYIFPAFGDMNIRQITPDKCQTLIEGIQAEGKGKTADEIYSLLSIIFKGAIAYGIITKSPLAIVQIQKHVYQHGVALSKDEEKLLLTRLIESDFKIAAAIALYTGLRPNELKTAQIKGDFIIAINSKRKNKKVEYKRIPIIDALRPYLENGIPTLPTPQLLRRRVFAALPNHKLYDLRTAFYTRCDEYGVSQPARDEFVGHSGGALTNAYRDLSDEYLLKEARKLNEWK
jgi:integrase